MNPVLLIGEVNPLSTDPDHALYDYPPGCAGHRLRRVLGLPSDQYLALYRTNLCVGDWSKTQAAARVIELLDPIAPWRVVVLLGRKVTEAFVKTALGGVPLVPFAARPHTNGRTIVSLPHPSGRNVVWNQPSARARTRELLSTFVPELPWGSVPYQAEAAA